VDFNFNNTATDKLFPDDVDIIVDAKKRRAWILHEKPLRAQDSLAGISYDTTTFRFTIRGKNGAEQVLDEIRVSEPLRADLKKVKTVTVMWVDRTGNIFDINELQLIFTGE
jgi:hypothetical protein